MQRRELLKGLAIGLPSAAGAAAVASAAFIRDKGSEAKASLEQRFDDLKARFEESDARNRKLVKVALGAAALSLGLDISALL